MSELGIHSFNGLRFILLKDNGAMTLVYGECLETHASRHWWNSTAIVCSWAFFDGVGSQSKEDAGGRHLSLWLAHSQALPQEQIFVPVNKLDGARVVLGANM